MVSRLGEVTMNRYAKHENAAYPTPCKGRLVTQRRALLPVRGAGGAQRARSSSELKAAGVTALKIEGRQRSRAYVAQVVAAFRAALDALARGERRRRRSATSTPSPKAARSR